MQEWRERLYHTSFDGETLPALSTVAVVGLGKIGLPLVVQYTQHGHRVIGCDINSQVVEMINKGQSHLQEEPGVVSGVSDAVAKGLLSATVDTSAAVHQAKVVVVIVPVLITAEHEVDFRAIDAATNAIGAGLQPGTLVVYETTLPVGTTSQRLCHLLEYTSGLRAGVDFFLAHSPERVFSGRILRDLLTYPKIVGGINEASTASAMAFYKSVLDVPIITMSSADEAEFVKLIESVYRDVNIALANEFACYADARGLNITSAIAAANSQPTSHIHMPGVGVGGHCIPVYPYFLLSDAEERTSLSRGKELPTLELTRSARRINDSMAEYAVRRLEAVIGPLTECPILILGVSYRGGVRETAFTTAKLLQDALMKRGAVVYVDDPLFDDEELQALGYTPLPPELESGIWGIILQADHAVYRDFDFGRFVGCQVVLDGRRILHRETIVSLGMRYIALGDGGNPLPLKRQEDELTSLSSEA